MSKRIYFGVSFILLTFFSLQLNAVEPTEKNIRYSDKYERSIFDIWTVKSDKPAPLVIYFHGGAFRFGDKGHFYRSPFLKDYQPKGIAFATANYPFLAHTNNSYPEIMQHCQECVKFIKQNSEKYNIDPDKVCVMGSSAGALISCYLGHGTDSSVKGIYAHLQPIGTEFLTMPFLKKGGPPIILYNPNANDKVHPPQKAELVQERCEKLGVFSEAYGGKGTNLLPIPPDQKLHHIVMKMFYKSWGMDLTSSKN